MNPEPRFTVSKAELVEALRVFRRVVDARSRVPVLTHVRIRSCDGERLLQGTNLDTLITYVIPPETPGSPLGARLLAMRWAREACDFLVPMVSLAEAAKRCDRGGSVILEPLPKSSVRITCPLGGVATSVNVLSLPLKDFPAHAFRELLDAAPEASIPPGHFLRAREAASDDDSRFVLNGVCLWAGQHSKEKKRKNAAHAIVGTDGRTLFVGNSLHFPWNHDCIIPKNCPADLLPLDVPWRVRSARGKGDDFWRLSAGRWCMEGRAVCGIFPNWRQVIPSATIVGLELTPEALATLGANVPRLPLSPNGDPAKSSALVDVAVTPEGMAVSVGEARVSVPAKVTFHNGACPDCREYRASFNREFLLRPARYGLRSWAFVGEGAPLMATSLDETFLSMPFRRG